ncbi:MAG: TIGR03435 family protein [Acidobacteria bacterium]|nr:TIGR03435 family protein [Acidobacteriota bacterium]
MKPAPRMIGSFFLTAALVSQQPKASGPPGFEVVSIRRVPLNAAPILRSQDFTPVLPGGQYIDSRTTLLFMIAFAYNVKFPSRQLVGLPNWAKEQSYAVAAKPAEDFPTLPPAENLERVRLMLRTMLTDRFHLRVHTETRRERVYDLKVANGGIKLQEVDPPVPPAKEGRVNAAMGDSGGRMIGNKSTMAGIATALAIFLKQPVVDRTGLRGYYDFDVRWSAPETAREHAPGGLGTEGIGLLISNLRNQFGLIVKKATGPVEYCVVDHVEPPAEN